VTSSLVRPGGKRGTATSARLEAAAQARRQQNDERRGWRPDILDGHDVGDFRLGGQTLLGSQRLRRSATHDGLR
jgi:hypothetical protein